MANSYNIWSGDGTAGPFNVTFDYILTDHVSVYVDGVLQTADTHYSWMTSTSIKFEAGHYPDLGAVILFKRSSSPEARQVNFQPTQLTEEDLDTDSLQAFYLAQEAVDTANDALARNTSAQFDAGTSRIINVGDPVDAQDVITKAYGDSTYNGGVTAASEAAVAASEAAALAAAAAEDAQEATEAAALAAVTSGEVYLGSTSLAGDSEVTFTDLAAHGYDRFKIRGTAVSLSDVSRVALRIATSGITYRSDDFYAELGGDPTSSVASDTEIDVTTSIDVGSQVNFSLEVVTTGAGFKLVTVEWVGFYSGDVRAERTYWGIGTSDDIVALRFFPISGTLTAGTITLYGIKTS